LIIFVKFLDIDKRFFTKIEVGNKDELLYWCN